MHTSPSTCGLSISIERQKERTLFLPPAATGVLLGFVCGESQCRLLSICRNHMLLEHSALAAQLFLMFMKMNGTNMFQSDADVFYAKPHPALRSLQGLQGWAGVLLGPQAICIEGSVLVEDDAGRGPP
eukprot:scaffold257319_cov19-Prasinocladus_malaysianus.AAC.1